MNFEWDENKRLANLAKHGIDLDDVDAVFADPDGYDGASAGEHGERRFVRIGKLAGLIVTVVYTTRGDATRIISARVARRSERARYGGRSH
jgi:uncharacterized protein